MHVSSPHPQHVHLVIHHPMLRSIRKPHPRLIPRRKDRHARRLHRRRQMHRPASHAPQTPAPAQSRRTLPRSQPARKDYHHRPGRQSSRHPSAANSLDFTLLSRSSQQQDILADTPSQPQPAAPANSPGPSPSTVTFGPHADRQSPAAPAAAEPAPLPPCARLRLRQAADPSSPANPAAHPPTPRYSAASRSPPAPSCSASASQRFCCMSSVNGTPISRRDPAQPKEPRIPLRRLHPPRRTQVHQHLRPPPSQLPPQPQQTLPHSASPPR